MTVNAQGIEIDGKWLCDFRTISEEAKRQARQGYRFWQAFYNIAADNDQLNWRHPWPKLFYAREYSKGMAEFSRYFEVIDGYIVPKEFNAGVLAKAE